MKDRLAVADYHTAHVEIMIIIMILSTLIVAISQLELLICSNFQLLLTHQVKSQAQKEHLFFSQLWTKNFKIIGFCRLHRFQWYIFLFQKHSKWKHNHSFHREKLISYVNTCKSTKFYFSSLIFWKPLINFKNIYIHRFSRFVGAIWA